MNLLQKYIGFECARNLLVCSFAFCLLFLTFDFFDRIDNVVTEHTSFLTIIQYFLLKIPTLFALTLPIAMLVSSMFTVAMLAKNSELTAMRAAGLKVTWIVRPIFLIALIASLVSIVVNETLVPYSQRRVKEIYNIDIKQRDKSGEYSQDNFWWRSGDTIYSTSMFDSRTKTLFDLTRLRVNKDFSLSERTESKEVSWVNPLFGWSMKDVWQYKFTGAPEPSSQRFSSLTLPISEKPRDFHDVETDPFTMSYFQLKRFIEKQSENGVSASNYFSDLYAKLAFPFVNLICTLVALPFALRTARSRKMGPSFMAGLIIGFSYYAIHSFSIALGRAELIPAFMAAWSANVLMGVMGAILLWGAEAPE
ncbi:MAG: LPS export ABC transporter permease LptG [Bdellovibrionales bacterium]|nr:LPS export ABC transporter permease LptG [Bdellovibrionales bacterium]